MGYPGAGDGAKTSDFRGINIYSNTNFFSVNRRVLAFPPRILCFQYILLYI
jgi:hypothetical protein